MRPGESVCTCVCRSTLSVEQSRVRLGCSFPLFPHFCAHRDDFLSSLSIFIGTITVVIQYEEHVLRGVDVKLRISYLKGLLGLGNGIIYIKKYVLRYLSW